MGRWFSNRSGGEFLHGPFVKCMSSILEGCTLRPFASRHREISSKAF
jgi:hypothetical protein